MVVLFAGCSSDEILTTNDTNQQQAARPSQNTSPQLANPNKVLLLKVDFLTHTFEGGKELVFKNVPGFTIMTEYQPPIDFGGISIIYGELDQPVFTGTIHWMGLGQMQYPDHLESAASFQTTNNPFPMPDAALFEPVAYDQFAYYPEPVPYAEIWDAIENLQIVAQYRSSNPNAKVSLFLYTPSVGMGNPADWDYFVILKN